ncbi:hypothetical protein C8Q77DRAFT_1156148 [Trametes polyzona]|nr:hypothetical protein C8Q77DRAFT_1156148 [Trametes polyzona]
MSSDGHLAGLFAQLCVLEQELDEPDFDDDSEMFSQAAHTSCLSQDQEDHEEPQEDANGSQEGESPHRNRTKSYRDYHNSRGPGSLAAAVRLVLHYMRSKKVDLPLLLWAISYNLLELINDELVKFERSAFLASLEFLCLLRTWHTPPRGHSRGIRSKGARAALDTFAFERILTVARKEMAAVGTYMRTQPDELSSDALLSIRISDMKQDVQARAPTLWRLLRECSWTPRQQKENKLKDPDATILYMISMSSFLRSNRNNALQRLMAVYLKSCGTSAKAFDTLSSVGLSMSQVWVYGALERLSKSERESLWEDLQVFPWFGSHDNVNFRFRVFEQRSDHQSHFDSGTAGTIFIIKDPAAVLPSAALLRAHRLSDRSRSLITGTEVLALEARSAPRLATCAIDMILQTLLDSVPFDRGTYEHAADDLLKPAPCPGRLRVGAQSNVRQYILDTVHIEEASYDGNMRVMNEWLRQLRLDTLEEQKRTGMERVIPWVGDQLTTSRLRGLLHFRRDDYNSFERLDWLIPTFGWFHLLFAFEHSLHSQYYGTRTGLGLVHAFDILGRKGLHTTSTQGTFHHTFEEALEHTFRAHIRALWCFVGGVEKLEDLRTRTPKELLALATQIYEGHASTFALTRLETTLAGMPQKLLDPLHRQIIQFLRDTLDYIVLRRAVSHGDVGTMQDMLPRLIFRFSGGSNSNYTIEVCELMQNLQYDWTEDLKNHIRTYCWLTNTGGHEDSYIPVDQAEEYNVCDVKYTFAAIIWKNPPSQLAVIKSTNH